MRSAEKSSAGIRQGFATGGSLTFGTQYNALPPPAGIYLLKAIAFSRGAR
jgi:hypothetical protein